MLLEVIATGVVAVVNVHWASGGKAVIKLVGEAADLAANVEIVVVIAVVLLQ